MEETISGIEDVIKKWILQLKKMINLNKLRCKTARKSGTLWKDLWLTEIKEGEPQVKGTENILNKIIEENSPNLNKEMLMKVLEAYRTQNRRNQKRNSAWHRIIKTLNVPGSGGTCL